MPNDSKITLDKEPALAADFSPPSYEEWKKTAEEHLKGVPFEKALVTRTYEEIDLQPIYCKTDIENLPHLKGKPGFGNYARGTRAEGYLENAWDISQAITAGLPEDFNTALKRDLERGQTAVRLTPDAATLRGVDPDKADPGQVGNGGVSIAGLPDLETALKDIDLEKYPLHMNAGFSARVLAMALAALFKKEGRDLKQLSGGIDADPLGYLAVHGQVPTTLPKTYDHMAQVTGWAHTNAPQLKTIGVSGAPFHNAGASAVQELAFALATAVEYIDQLTERGLSVDDICGNIRFTFAIGPFYFMEVAKLRAARILWAKIVEAYGGNESSRKMTIHGVTSYYNQTMYDPYVNMLRTTTEAFSAVVGGVDSLQTNPFDQVFGSGDAFSRRIARNTQVILKEESHLDQLIDPAGGSYYVEKLTADAAEKAWALFKDIETQGGMLKALENGVPQGAVKAVAAKRRKDLGKRKAVMVGTNTFANVKEEKLPLRFPDCETLQAGRSRLVKERREAVNPEEKGKITQSLFDLMSNTSPDTVDIGAEAFLAGATYGEMFAATGHGESEKITPLKIHRAADMFEELRDAAAAFDAKTGAKPTLFLATMGPLRQHKARADFSKGFFETGGFDVIHPNGFDTPEAAVEAAVESKAPVVVICSTDPTYPDLVPPITKGLKEKIPDIQVVLAGYPKDQIDAHKAAGVDHFIYLGADAHGILSDVLKKAGVLA